MGPVPVLAVPWMVVLRIQASRASVLVRGGADAFSVFQFGKIPVHDTQFVAWNPTVHKLKRLKPL
jgi:hypothetical protein